MEKKEPDAELKSGLLAFFSSNGLPTEEIPRAKDKTPDILVCKGASDEVLLEIKQKEDDWEEIAELNADLEAGGIVSRSKSLQPWNRADTVIRNAIRQMKAVDPSRGALRVVWVHCIGHYSAVYAKRLKATIYGMQTLVSEDINNLVHCFYFHESTFFRRRNELDAVVVWEGNKAYLYLNDHSPHFQRMLRARFSQCFPNGLYYPAQFSDEPSMLVHDGQEERAEDDVALIYLRKKYSLSHLQLMPMGYHSIGMRQPEQ